MWRDYDWGPHLTEEKSKHVRVLVIAGIVLAAWALRFVAISLRGAYLGWDETMSLMMGRNLLCGRGYQFNGLPNITFPALPAIIAAAVWMITG